MRSVGFSDRDVTDGRSAPNDCSSLSFSALVASVPAEGLQPVRAVGPMNVAPTEMAVLGRATVDCLPDPLVCHSGRDSLVQRSALPNTSIDRIAAGWRGPAHDAPVTGAAPSATRP